MRKLASIKQISEIYPIEGKDRIVLAIIDGWSVIVQKSQFNVGDKVVYIEIDSVLPDKPEFEFLKSKRIKTMKMAGVISQGIAFPLSILPEKEYSIGDDVTDIIGIKQYEPTMDIEPKTIAKGYKEKSFWHRLFHKKKDNSFPSFIAKTDETRIQNMPFILKDKSPWVATEKIDGQSGTFCLVRHKRFLPFLKDKFEFMVCSRNYRLVEKDNSSYWYVAQKYHLEEVLKAIIGNNKWVAIQGECIAPNVQKNKYKVKEPDLFVFNVVYPNGRKDSISAKALCEGCGLKFAPIISTNFILPDTVQEVLSYAHGDSALGNTIREGIVFRSSDGARSFKAVDPLFLLKYDE